MIRNVIWLVAIVILCVSTQAQNASVNIKGTITDIATGKPVGKEMDMEIIGKNTGKKFVIKVNSKSGEYLQPLPSGDVYTLTFKSFAVFKKTETLEIVASQKFREERHDYTVRSIIQGYEIANVSAFDAGQSSILSSAHAKLEEVREALRLNRDLRVIITVGNENYPPPPPAPKKEVKVAKKPVKGKKGATVSVDSAPVKETLPVPTGVNPAVYDARVAGLKQYFVDVKNAEIRIVFQSGESVNPASGVMNVRAVVGEVKSLLDE